MILVGNKCDLTNRQVQHNDAQDFADSYDMQYFEVSALSGLGVEDLFKYGADTISGYID
jgi:GTPase SAR1 family protein